MTAYQAIGALEIIKANLIEDLKGWMRGMKGIDSRQWECLLYWHEH